MGSADAHPRRACARRDRIHAPHEPRPRELASTLPTVVLITLKNGGLVANAFIGCVFLGKRYSARQLGAIAVVSLGLIATAKGGGKKGGAQSDDADAGAAAAAAEAALAVACACAALLCRALNGALTELAFAHSRTRASASELLFYRNLFALPVFVLRYDVVATHALRWHDSSEVGGLAWPRMWLLLVANIVFDYLCKVLMTQLIATEGSLQATIALNAQKFCAFIISTTLLDPSLRSSPRLWVGAGCVLGGSVAYSTICKPPAGGGTKGGRMGGDGKQGATDGGAGGVGEQNGGTKGSVSTGGEQPTSEQGGKGIKQE